MADVLLSTSDLATRSGTVRVARFGDGPDPLVLVHGYPDNLQIWSRVAPLLAEHRSVIAFDWPGLGRSSPVQGGATPFHLGRQFIDVLDALEVEQATPVGFDMGAHAVVAAAHAAPERVSRLVLTNFLAFGTIETSWEISLMRRLGLNRLFIGRLPRVVFLRAERTFAADKLTDDVREDLWSTFREPSVRRRLVKMCTGYQASLARVAALYPSLTMLVDVVWADSDPHFPLAQAHELVAQFPTISLTVMEATSHWFMWDNPARTAAAILNRASL
jgi:pimeloyl-ACP methyl ester carboxylesterase